MPLDACCTAGMDVVEVVVCELVYAVRNIAITGSAGTANVTAHAAASTVNGVILIHVPFLSMKGATLDEDMLQG